MDLYKNKGTIYININNCSNMLLLKKKSQEPDSFAVNSTKLLKEGLIPTSHKF